MPPRYGAAALVAPRRVFAQRLQASASSTAAFGANLIGAMLGGTLEYLALITGYRFLLLVVGALYSLAFLTGRLVLRTPAAA